MYYSIICCCLFHLLFIFLFYTSEKTGDTTLETFNHTTFTLIHSLAGHAAWQDALGIAIGEYLPYLFIAVEVYFYFFARRKDAALLAFYAVLLGLGINQLIGWVYFHPRPFMVGLGTPLVPHVAENSFPSDHTTFMASIAFAFLLLSGMRRWGVVLLILAILGGLGRVYIGVHFPLDIAGSLVTSLIAALVIVAARSRLSPLSRLVYRIEDFIFR
jgi:undecaprenyl-diphosphatase